MWEFAHMLIFVVIMPVANKLKPMPCISLVRSSASFEQGRYQTNLKKKSQACYSSNALCYFQQVKS